MRAFPLFSLLIAGCSGAAEPTPVSSHRADAVMLGAAPARRNQEPLKGEGPSQREGASTPPNEISIPSEPRNPTEAELARYAWLTPSAKVRPLGDVFAPPKGFKRVAAPAGSFAEFLRGLPLRPAGAEVNAYDGRRLHAADDPRIAAVAELDVSPTDIQQCADSVIRLHAEWVWSAGDKNTIAYHFLSGDLAKWASYAGGSRPVIEGNKVGWAQTAKAQSDHATFRKYLDVVFNYASTISVAKMSSKEVDRSELRAGDFFVLPGGPGHAILILDVAEDANGKRVALLGQGFMPAQDFQVLRDTSRSQSAWFPLDDENVDTPFWPVPFPWSSLHRMK